MCISTSYENIAIYTTSGLHICFSGNDGWKSRKLIEPAEKLHKCEVPSSIYILFSFWNLWLIPAMFQERKPANQNFCLVEIKGPCFVVRVYNVPVRLQQIAMLHPGESESINSKSVPNFVMWRKFNQRIQSGLKLQHCNRIQYMQLRESLWSSETRATLDQSGVLPFQFWKHHSVNYYGTKKFLKRFRFSGWVSHFHALIDIGVDDIGVVLFLSNVEPSLK